MSESRGTRGYFGENTTNYIYCIHLIDQTIADYTRYLNDVIMSNRLIFNHKCHMIRN